MDIDSPTWRCVADQHVSSWVLSEHVFGILLVQPFTIARWLCSCDGRADTHKHDSLDHHRVAVQQVHTGACVHEIAHLFKPIVIAADENERAVQRLENREHFSGALATVGEVSRADNHIDSLLPGVGRMDHVAEGFGIGVRITEGQDVHERVMRETRWRGSSC